MCICLNYTHIYDVLFCLPFGFFYLLKRLFLSKLPFF
nr:MAG TPA: hypothetical protein [Caudoviricetes sp.]